MPQSEVSKSGSDKLPRECGAGSRWACAGAGPAKVYSLNIRKAVHWLPTAAGKAVAASVATFG